jgi:D-sedoheptulose 7-phosphate isomerase
MDHRILDAEQRVASVFRRTAELHLEAADSIAGDVAAAAFVVTEALRSGNKVLLCGNGGSAADAQHIAAELAGRLSMERAGLPAVALTVNPSIITAVSNDYGYDMVFARQVEALGCRGDVLVGISTSGSSANVIRALEKARGMGVVTVGLMGRGGAKMAAVCDHLVQVPSSETQRIQELHIAVGHAICEIAEAELFGGRKPVTG